jgi:hypothetical protein
MTIGVLPVLSAVMCCRAGWSFGQSGGTSQVATEGGGGTVEQAQ